MTKQKIPRSIGTHDGPFHADEVTACALLILFGLADANKIVRTRNLDALHSCEFVCDVGGVYNPQNKLFDHHQIDYQGPLSSAGMVLLYLKESGTIHPKEYDLFNNTLILGVDAHDNGKDPQILGLCTYSNIITSFVPLAETDRTKMESAFYEALNFSRGFLERLQNRYYYTQSCRELVAKAMAESKDYLLLDRNIPWTDLFFELDGEHHPALFVVMPAEKHWKLRGIPPTRDKKMQVRQPLPQEWAGLLDEDLQRVTGLSGAIFCHKGRFISVWQTREDAMRALEYVLAKRASHE